MNTIKLLKQSMIVRSVVIGMSLVVATVVFAGASTAEASASASIEEGSVIESGVVSAPGATGWDFVYWRENGGKYAPASHSLVSGNVNTLSALAVADRARLDGRDVSPPSAVGWDFVYWSETGEQNAPASIDRVFGYSLNTLPVLANLGARVDNREVSAPGRIGWEFVYFRESPESK